MKPLGVTWQTASEGAMPIEAWATAWVAALLRREGYPSVSPQTEAA